MGPAARTDRRLKRGPCLAVPLLVEEVEIKVAGRTPQLGLGAKLELGRTCLAFLLLEEWLGSPEALCLV